MDASELKTFVNATDADMTFLAECVAVATDFVDSVTDGVSGVPQANKELAIRALAAWHWTIKKSPSGVLTTGEGAVVRLGRDPYAIVRPYLTPFVVFGL